MANAANWVLAVAAYLIGSLSFAVLVSRLFGMADPRTYGSGNPGATNVLRSGRKVAAALTLAGDAFKGWLPVFVALHFQAAWGVSLWGIAAASVAVLAGHMWPLYFGFKGGKGVATAAGVLLALNAPVALVCIAVWLVMAFGFRISSLAALVATIAAPVGMWLFAPVQFASASAVISLLVLYRHKSNIRNLISGRESRIGDKTR